LLNSTSANVVVLGYIGKISFIGGWKNKMENSLIEKDLYTLPYYQQAKPKWSFHIPFFILVFMFLGFILIPGTDQVKIIMNVIWLVFAIFFGYFWLAVAFFNKPYLKITDESLEYGRKVISLNSVHKVEFFSGRGGRGVSKLVIRGNEQGKRSFWRELDRFVVKDYSVGDFSVVILGSIFSNIDLNKLALTIIEKVKANNS
jgi:hypothetical protein